MVRMEFHDISEGRNTEEYLLILREHGGERLLPVSIGSYEARAIARASHHEASLRPSTHDLLSAVIARLGGTLVAAVIHDLRAETFYCQLELQGERGLLEVDCRTSDAVALALRTDSPIFATEDVLAQAAVVPKTRTPRSGGDAVGH